MNKITFNDLPEMVALILEKLDRIEKLIGSGEKVDDYIGKEMLNATEAAEFMGVSKSLLYKMSFNSVLPVYKPTGKKIYFKKDDLVDHLKQNRIMSAKEIEQETVNFLTKRQSKRSAERFK